MESDEQTEKMTDLIEKKIFDNIKAWSHGIKRGPVLATLRVTNICDLQCRFCTSKNEKQKKGELTIKDYEKLFKSLYKLNVKVCAIVGGGEALCKKKLTTGIVKLINIYKMKGWLVTNGVNFDTKMINDLIKLKFDSILFSIDGANAKTHDYLRDKKGAFDKAIKSIQLFNKLKQEFRSNKPNLKIQMLVTIKNYHQIEDMISLARSLKTTGLLLNFLVEHTPECKKLKLNKKEFSELKIKIKSLLKDKKIRKFTNFEEFLQIMKLIENRSIYKYNEPYSLGYCYQPWYHLNITETGYINMCPELYKWQKENIRQKNVYDIWYGKAFEEFRKKIREKIYINLCNKFCNLPIIVENLKISKLLN